MLINTMTYSDNNINAKRIYLANNYILEFTCPKCSEVVKYNKCVPLISYGEYCHVFYCDECGYESKDKMYTLNEIFEHSVDVTFSNNNQLELIEF